MNKLDFTRTLSSLLDNDVFMGRASNLQNSLTLLVNALESGKEFVPANEISAQVSAGWMAHASGAKVGAVSEYGQMKVSDAWSYLYEQMGMLGNDIYKKTFREKLETEFREKPNQYPKEIKELWRTVFADQKGPKESKFSKLEGFLEDFMPKASSKATAASIGHHSPEPANIMSAYKSALSAAKKDFPEFTALKDSRGEKLMGCKITGVECQEGQQSIFKISGKNHALQDRELTIDFKNEQVRTYDNRIIPFREALSKLGPMEKAMYRQAEEILKHFKIEDKVSPAVGGPQP